MAARLARFAALIVLLPALGWGSVQAEDLPDAEWKKARKQARSLMKHPGKRFAKFETIRALGRDDSRRAAEILVQWTVRSLKLQQGALTKALDAARDDLDQVEKVLRKVYERMPPTRVEDKNNWLRVKRKFDAALTDFETETAVRFSLGESFEAIRDLVAVTYLIEDGLPAVRKVKHSEDAQIAMAKCLFRQPKHRVRRTVIAMANDAKWPKLRIHALNWFGQHKIVEGFDALVGALHAREVGVRRAAVLALQGLDERRAVKPLIDAMQRSEGQLRAEIDDALHWFTGRSFEASPAVWKRWWEKEGAAWLATEAAERHHRKREELPGGTKVRFYGIPTESHHVVFVLDRSGSMKHPAGDESIEKKKDKPKGPVTGGDGSKKGRTGKGRDAVAGDTKMEVAKNQLALSIDELTKGVNFAVVFYSNEVQVWKPPPELMPSSSASKASAKKWFMSLDPVGSTLMFAALQKALEYADTIGEDKKKPRTGADTIFLLSDGSPTDENGEILSATALEEQYAAFLKANELYHCVVHTVGIGPLHNSAVLERLARDTGGQYKAVGTK